MDKFDILQLVIAGWGAILSTILVIYKLFEDKNRIKLRFTHIVWYEYQELAITNVGKNPITIKEIGIILRYGRNLKYDPYSLKPIEPLDIDQEFLPKKLDKGESILVKFQLDFEQLLIQDSFICIVKDINGKKYTCKELNVFDGKYKYDMKIKRKPKATLKNFFEDKEK